MIAVFNADYAVSLKQESPGVTAEAVAFQESSHAPIVPNLPCQHFWPISEACIHHQTFLQAFKRLVKVPTRERDRERERGRERAHPPPPSPYTPNNHMLVRMSAGIKVTPSYRPVGAGEPENWSETEAVTGTARVGAVVSRGPTFDGPRGLEEQALRGRPHHSTGKSLSPMMCNTKPDGS